MVSTDLECAEDKGRAQYVGIRFDELQIPPRALITHSTIKFTVDEVSLGNALLNIYVEESDDAQPYTEQTGELSSRVRSLSSIPWEPGEWHQVGASGPRQCTSDLSLLSKRW